MADLSQQIGFSVLFDLTQQIPLLVVADNGNYPAPALTSRAGYFRIVTPDGTVRNYPSTGDTGPSNLSFSYPLPLATDGMVQQGAYNISFQIIAAGFTNTTLTNIYNLAFDQVQTAIAPAVNLSTPSIIYSDNTNYTINGFNAPSVSRAWTAKSTPTGTFSGSASIFDLTHNGSIFDSAYAVSLISTATYVSSSAPTFSVKTSFSISDAPNNVTFSTYSDMIGWVTALKAQPRTIDFWGGKQHIAFLHASALLSMIKQLACNNQYTGIDEYINELYRTTHNGVSYNPVRTNNAITAGAADLCNCGTSSSSESNISALAISVQPQSGTLTAGSNLTLDVIAAGGSGTKTYQWRKSTDSGTTWTNIGGATASIYSISTAQTSDSGTYDVIVTDSSNSSVTSANAVMVVNASNSGGGGNTTATGYMGIAQNYPTTAAAIMAGTPITIPHNANTVINWPYNGTPMIYWFAQPNTEQVKTKSNDGTSDDTIGAGHSWNGHAVESFELYATENDADSLVTTTLKIS